MTKRRSTRQKERKQQKEAAAVAAGTRRGRNNNNNRPASTKQQSSSASTKQQSSSVTKKKARIVNPYAKTNKKNPPPAKKKKPPPAKKTIRRPPPPSPLLLGQPSQASSFAEETQQPATQQPATPNFIIGEDPPSDYEEVFQDDDQSIPEVGHLPIAEPPLPPLGIDIDPNAVPVLTPTAPSIPLLRGNNGEVDFQAIQPTYNEFTLNGILRSIRDNPMHLQTGNMVPIPLSDLSGNSKTYMTRKSGVERLFFQAVANHPTAAPMAELIEDPDNPGTQIYRLYTLVRGLKALWKKELLNWCILNWSLTHIKVRFQGMDLSDDPILFAQAQYQSSTIQNHFKMLFSSFALQQINYESRDFRGPGK